MTTNEDALEDVYKRRHRTFAKALAALTGSIELGDEVVQESFARALARIEQFRGDGPLEAWVWRIAIRTAIEFRRTSSRLELGVELDPQLPKAERDPELAAAIRHLPPRRRLVVFLRYVADLSYVEIARTCGISEGTVAATLAQARESLAEELGYAGPTRLSKGGMK
ncbi:MAG: polymerase sigma-70 factor, subfamily [Gaiellaceae bacterium]|jgi:RNA polymerase sigma-70 factor (ECF subfamily)|nr:polymerase sigma-70 factor, subfamily [Gaiellaceae bacterium]